MTRDPLHLTAAVLVGTLAVARATRLVTSDGWPPMQNFRRWWVLRQAQRDADYATAGNGHDLNPRGWLYGWGDLFLCAFCFAPYAAAADLALAWYSDLADWWWAVNIWATVSYLAAMIVARDEPPAE